MPPTAQPPDLFQPRLADTTFRMSNVHAVAETIGARLGISGPYFPDCYSEPQPGLLCVRIGALTFPIDGALYKSIVTRAITAEQLKEDLIIDRLEVAEALCRTVRHLHRTGPVRARAFEWEFARVTRARNLEPRRRQLRGQADTEADTEAGSEAEAVPEPAPDAAAPAETPGGS